MPWIVGRSRSIWTRSIFRKEKNRNEELIMKSEELRYAFLAKSFFKRIEMSVLRSKTDHNYSFFILHYSFAVIGVAR